MSSIDDRIVNMQFNNAQFEKGIDQSVKSLGDLDDALQLPYATSGLDDAQAAADSFSLANIESALDDVAGHFSVFGAAAFTVIQNLTDSALQAGKNIAGAILDPLINGGERRAEAIQQAQFQFQGLGLNVADTMNAAKAAVLGTAYGLDDAATAAAQFGASGITAANGLTNVLRSVAGVAAQTGSSYSNIANIFETVAGNGRLMGDQLNQLSSYGINAAAILAKSLGTTESNVRDLVSQGKISFQQFSDSMNAAFGANAAKANELFSGALSNMHAALARIGADVQSVKLNNFRDLLNTLSPIIDNIHTALGPLIDDFNTASTAATKIGIGMINAFAPHLIDIIGSITGIIERLRTAIGAGFGEVFTPDAVMTTARVGEALANFFNAIDQFVNGNANTLQRTFAGFFAILDIGYQIVSGFIGMLLNLLGFATQGTGGFLEFTAKVGDWLVAVDQAIKQGNFLTDFFRVLGNVLQVPIAIFKLVAGALGSVIDAIAKFNTSGLTAGIDAFGDDMKKRFSGLVSLGAIINGFFTGIAIAAKATWDFMKPFFEWVGQAIGIAVSVIKQVMSGISFEDALQTVNTGLFAGLILMVKKFVDMLKDVFDNGFGSNGSIKSAIKGVLSTLTDNLKAMQAQTNAKTLTEIAIAVALLAASAVALSLVDTLKLAQALYAISALMGSLIGTFAALNAIGKEGAGTVKLTAIASIFVILATSILVLSAAVAILAALPFDRLSAAIGAIIVLLGSLVGTLWSINAIGPRVLIGVAAISMLAPAMILLATALAILSAIPLDNLATALGGLIVALGALVGALWSINAIGPRVIIGVAAIATLAPAMVILSSAIAILSAIPFDNLVLGLGAFVVILAGLVGALWAVTKIGPNILIAAAAIAVMAPALALLAGAVALLAALPFDNLVLGLGAFVVIIAAVVGAFAVLNVLKGSLITGALAIAVVAASINLLVAAVALLGSMSIENLIKGVVGLAAVLAILVISILVLGASAEVAIVGAAAILVVAAALAILAPAVKLLGTMSWDDIGRSMAVLGAAIAILAVGGVLLIPASVGFLLFGAAMILVGTGVKALGEGILALSIGIAGLVVVGVAGLAIVGQAIDLFISKLPALGVGFGAAIVSMVVTIGEEAPQLITAFVNILLAMLLAIDQVVPAIINTATIIIVALVNALVILIPLLVDAGLKMVDGILTGIANNIGPITDAAIDIMTNFLNALASKLPSLIDAGTNVIIAFIHGIANSGVKITNAALDAIVTFINGIADAINKHTNELNAAGANLAFAIVNGLTGGLASKVASVVSAAKKLVEGIPAAIKKFLGIASPSKVTTKLGEFTGDGVVNGLANREDDVYDASQSLANSAVSGLKDSLSGVSEAFASADISSPTIRPVVDLSSVKKSVSQIPGLMPQPSISLDTSNNVATSVALQDQAKNAQLTIDATQPAQPAQQISYVQNNYSPKALTTTELYRQTKNQLSTLKEDLGVVDQSGGTQ